MNNIYLLATMQLRTKDKMAITTDGNCMIPIINDKDIIEVSAVQKYCVGDIVLVLVKNQLCIHRIISKDKKGYITKGDHSFLADKRSNAKILGKAIMNCTQNHSLCKNSIRSKIKAIISKNNAKMYRKYLKEKNNFWRTIFLKIYVLSDKLLLYI